MEARSQKTNTNNVECLVSSHLWVFDVLIPVFLGGWGCGPVDASFGFYLKEAFQSQNHTKKLKQRQSLGTDMLVCYRNWRTAIAWYITL